MSLLRNCDAYRAYCNLCFYTDQIPLSYNKWNKQSHNLQDYQNKTVEDIQKELNEILEYT